MTAYMDRFANAAHQSVLYAIKRGRLQRPTACSKCGNAPPPMRDGRNSIVAFQPNLHKQLDLIWVCRRCRHALTAYNAGENNGRAILTWSKVERIRKAIAQGAERKDLADAYGVSVDVIANIAKNRAWRTA